MDTGIFYFLTVTVSKVFQMSSIKILLGNLIESLPAAILTCFISCCLIDKQIANQYLTPFKALSDFPLKKMFK